VIRLPAILQVFKVDTTDLERAQVDADRVSGGLGSSIAKGVAVGGAALVGLGAVGVKSAMGVEKGLAEVVTLTGKVGSEAREQMGVFGTGVREVSDEFGIAQDVLTNGLYQAISAGVPADNVFDFLKVASKASIAGVTDVDTAVDGISSTLNAFGLDASQAEAVADSMFAAVAGGKTTFEELSSSVATVAPAAAAAGVGFDEVFAGVATLTSAGKSTSEATTMMRAALTAVQKPTEALTEVFQAAGYESGEAALEAVGLAGALDIVMDASGGSSGELQNLLGRVEAVGAAQIIAGTGAEKMTEEMDRQANAAGGLDRGYSVMADTADQAWNVLKTRLMNSLTELGFKLLPRVNAALDSASAAFTWASQNAAAMRPWLIGIGTAIAVGILPPLAVYIQQQAVAAIAAVRSAASQYAASLRVIASWVGQAAAATAGAARVVWGWVTSAGGALSSAATQVAAGARVVAGWVAKGAAAAAGAARVVAGWAVAGAGALRGAATQAASAARVVAGWVLMGVQSLAAAAKVALAWLISIGPIALVIAAVVGLVVVIVKNWETIKNAVTKAARAVWDFVVRAFNTIRSAVSSAVAAVRGAVTNAFNAVRSAVQNAVNAVRTAVTNAFNAVRTTITGALNTVVGIVRALPGRFVSALASLASQLAGVATRAWTSFRERVSSGITTAVALVTGLPGRVLSALGNLGSTLFNAGKALLRGFVDGIKAMARAPVDAVKGMLGKVRNLLPFSPAKEGPFSGRGWTLYSGRAISEALATGIHQRAREAARAGYGVAQAASEGLAAGLDAAQPAQLAVAGTLDPALTPTATATAQLAGRLDGGLAQLAAQLAQLGDREDVLVIDLGDGITQRYRVERLREANARTVREGAR
jgi:TP901 family phage tail tape measure protein